MITRNLLKHNIKYIAILVTISIAILSLAKIGKQTVINISHLDKIEHAIAYLVLTVLWLLSFKKKQYQLLVIVCAIIYGVLMEFLQANLTTYRYFDYLDMLANTFGVLLGFLIFKMIQKKQYKLLNSK